MIKAVSFCLFTGKKAPLTLCVYINVHRYFKATHMFLSIVFAQLMNLLGFFSCEIKLN